MVAPHPAPFPLRARCARLPLLLTLSLAAACGKQESAPATSEAAPAAAPGEGAPAPSRPGRAAPAVTLTEAEPYDSAELGGLHGTILFAGTAPARFELGATSNAECKHHPEVDQRSNEIVVNAGKLAGVFVALDSGIDRARIPPAPETPVTLEQKGCMYVPRVLALRVGQGLRVTNDDPANHNVHTYSKRNAALNKNMGAKQAALELRFDKAERPIEFRCDIHPWMGAAVFVEEHPWFALTDEQGAFRIRDVPPGEYGVEATHEKLGRVSGTVRVEAGKSTGFTLSLGK